MGLLLGIYKVLKSHVSQDYKTKLVLQKVRNSYYSRLISHVVGGEGGGVGCTTVSLEVTVELLQGLSQV